MTLEEALEKLKIQVLLPPNPDDKDLQHALKLGIEALKAWREIRREWRRPSSMLLPGETKEEQNANR